MSVDSITIEPPLERWPVLLRQQPVGRVFDRSLSEWREQTRRELGLPGDRPILATGHQPALWHPGILAKYLAVEAVRRADGDRTSVLNVIVDQDVVEYAALDVPMRRSDGSLASRRVEFASVTKVENVPVGWTPPFQPRMAEAVGVLEVPQLETALTRIGEALSAHAIASSAAAQLAGATTQLMHDFADVTPMPTVLASRLMRTTLGQRLMQAMHADPQRCAETYNRAVAAVPVAHLSPLSIRDDYVELPLWRLRKRDDGMMERVRAYDADLESTSPEMILLPRALCMTALLRLAVTDVFVHGRGGALYDQAMERWIKDWLGVDVSSMAVASADVRLPLMNENDLTSVRDGALNAARRRARMIRHDPESMDDAKATHPGAAKRSMLHDIERLPRRSHERRAAFLAMHVRLEELRHARAEMIERAESEVAVQVQRTADAVTAQRRDWAFPLYPRSVLREIAERMRAAAGA